MKILHVTDYLMPSMGYQDFLLAKWNKKQNNDTYIITSNKYYPVPNYDLTWKKFLGKREQKVGWSVIDGVKILRKNLYFEISCRPWISNLENEIKKIKPDVILVHNTTSFSSFRVAYLCKKESIPCMFDNHMVYSAVSNSLSAKLFYFFIKNFISKYISQVAFKIIGVTDETCKYLEYNEGYKKNKIFHLPLGIDEKAFYLTKKRRKRKKRETFKIIQTGKLNEDKKPQWTAKAVLEILKKGKNVSLEFIGGGSSKIRSQIENDFKKNNFYNKLKFTKFQDKKQLVKSYNNNDLCIFPDGTSLSAMEVAACKKPVIMADYLASRARARLGIGLTYKTGDLEDLQKKILLLINNKNYYQSVSKKSYEVVKKNFTYNDISKKFIKLCKKAIKN
tara:strand:- start:287 stop:1459 length:1173 start_codon:yes stop_codon:yes gene_type:complete